VRDITRVRTLSLAEADLYDGFLFYERKEPGVGSYFVESLSSDPTVNMLISIAG